MWSFLILLLLYILYWEFYPYRFLRKNEKFLDKGKNYSEKIRKYKVITHIHTQFSFDSLGKPSDIKKAMKENNIDFVFVTDHDNDNYKYFEDEKIFAGIEMNAKDGRLLKLGNLLPVISHPNNFEFEHYKWKGEFKEGYLYELINIKDIVVWSKLKTGFKLLKNIIIYPLTRNIIRKWNALLPLEDWVNFYFQRAPHLKIIGGLDLHIKVVYLEKTHRLLIPSYKFGFKWLVNYLLTNKELKTKEEVLNELLKGRSFLVLNQKFGEIWIENESKTFILGDKIPLESYIFINFPHEKTVKIIKKDNKLILVTEENNFSVKLKEKGKYHFECYEYDFKLGNLYFGFRPIAISNIIEVID